MNLNESTVEAAALEWSGDPPVLPRWDFGGQGWGYAAGHGRVNGSPFYTPATLRDRFLPKLLSGELTVTLE